MGGLVVGIFSAIVYVDSIHLKMRFIDSSLTRDCSNIEFMNDSVNYLGKVNCFHILSSSKHWIRFT